MVTAYRHRARRAAARWMALALVLEVLRHWSGGVEPFATAWLLLTWGAGLMCGWQIGEGLWGPRNA